jgi:Flp pilus assembly pilin Flp
MKNLLAEVMRDESGLILSAELVLILTICVLGIVVGLVQVQTAVVSEFQDLALAFSSLNTSFTAGSGFIDIFDGCIGSSWNGGMVGGSFGGGGGGYGGGYSEIGGMGYSGTSSSTATPGVVNPQVAPCDTCTPSSVTTTPYPGCDSLAPSTATQPSLQTPTPLPPPPVPTKD